MASTPHLHLSRRERQIMDSLYARGEATVSEVLEDLPDAPSYSAVRAMLRKLEEKGHLTHDARGARYVYRPTVPREAAQETAPGTELEESTVEFDELTPPFAWVGSFVNVDEGVLEDRGAGEDVVNGFVRRDVAAAVDRFVLSRTTHGVLSDEASP